MFKRKYEFKPDRSDPGTLNKLFITKKQRLAILKWLLTAVLIIAISLVQDVILTRFRIFGTTMNLTAAALLLICIMLDPEIGSVFILSASALYWFSGSAPGPYVIALLTVIGVMGAIIRQSYLYNSFGSVMLCTLLAISAYELIIFEIGCFLELTSANRLLNHMLGAGLSFCVMPLLYPVFKAIDKIGGNTWND